MFFHFFFLTCVPTTETYTLSLHDALPISRPKEPLPCARSASFWSRTKFCACILGRQRRSRTITNVGRRFGIIGMRSQRSSIRSEEHTSELQSLTNLVCRLLLEKKKKKQ